MLKNEKRKSLGISKKWDFIYLLEQYTRRLQLFGVWGCLLIVNNFPDYHMIAVVLLVSV